MVVEKNKFISDILEIFRRYPEKKIYRPTN